MKRRLTQGAAHGGSRLRAAIVAAVAASCLCPPLPAETKCFVGLDAGDPQSWFSDKNWEPAGYPQSGDDVQIVGKAVHARKTVSVRSITVGVGGSLELGDADTRPTFSVAIDGDFAVTGGGRVTVHAGRLTDTSVFADRALATLAIYRGATSVSVGGRFLVGEGSTVMPTCDPQTGTPVFFNVREFLLEKGATMDAVGRGWGWMSSTETFAFGHGTATSSTTWHGGSNAGSYGNALAPFLPGSPSKGGSNVGGGVVCVFATGAMTVNGAVNVVGRRYEYGGSSAGSIWLTSGQMVALGEETSLNAAGEKGTNGNCGCGEGGRICIVDGATAATVKALVGGRVPDGFEVRDLVDGRIVVTGGGVGTSKKADDGSCRRVTSLGLMTTVDVKGWPIEAKATDVVYGRFQAFAGGASTFVANAYGYANDRQTVRYSCVGYVVSNATAEVARGDSLSATVTPVAGKGPYTLTWLWGRREVWVHVAINGGGSVSVDGEKHDATFGDYFPSGKPLAFLATPKASDTRFACWTADELCLRDAAMEMPSDSPLYLTASFQSGDPVRRFLGARSNRWNEPFNWQPAGVPAADDEVVLETGSTVSAADCIVTAKSLALSGAGTKLVVGSSSWADNRVMQVSGDVSVSDGAKMEVHAHELSDMLAFTNRYTAVAALYRQASVAVIGGTLSVSGGGVVLPVNALVSGTPVFFEVGSLELAEDGLIDATGVGWSWQNIDSSVFPDGVIVKRGTQGGGGGQACYTYALDPSDGFSGYRTAPYLPGAPCAAEGTRMPGKGGGSVCVFASGRARIEGTVRADSRWPAYSIGASGGAIWVTAAEFAFGEHAVLSACDRRPSDVSDDAVCGSGGRIALGFGVRSAQRDALAAKGVFFKTQLAMASHLHDLPFFRASPLGHATMSVEAEPNGDFVFVDGRSAGLAVVVQ